MTLTTAQADVTNVAKQLEQAYPQTNEKRGVEVSPLVNEVFGQIRPAISLLFGAVAFVLVIACASVASLLLARTNHAAANSRCAARSARMKCACSA